MSALTSERPASIEVSEPPRLAGTIGRLGFFALSFGAVIGSGWVVMLGDWLRMAGPAGAVIGFAAGAAVMMLIGLCYGELAARFSAAGGEFLYTLETFGPRAGFIVAWFLTLYAVAICAFEGIAIAWFLRTLLPGIQLDAGYELAGEIVHLDALLIGVSAALGIGWLHYRGSRSAISFQNIVTTGFIVCSVVFVVCGFSFGSLSNLQPLWGTASNQSWLAGALSIFPSCAFFLNGWQTTLHAIEERRSDLTPSAAIRSMILAILAAASFYAGIVLAAGSAMPWMQVAGQDMAAVAAFRALGFNGVLGTLILVAAIISLAKTWTAVVWLASRIIFAQARHGLLPPIFARVHPVSGAPSVAIVAVTLLTLIGIFCGRGAILPIVDMVSICLALSMIFCVVVLLRRRRVDRREPSFSVPGGLPVILLALLGAVCMIGLALLQPLLRSGATLPVEWLLLLAWGALGLAIGEFRLRARRRL